MAKYLRNTRLRPLKSFLYKKQSVAGKSQTQGLETAHALTLYTTAVLLLLSSDTAVS